MKILITGASGALGSTLVEKLAEHELIFLVRNKNKATNLKGEIFEADITEFQKVTEIVEATKPEAIIHLAAIISKACEENPKLTKLVNVDGTRNLGEAAAKSGTKIFIFPSTAAVYKTDSPEKAKEENADPKTVYGKTKFEAELALKEISGKTPMKSVVMRIFNVYGPGIAGSLINKLVHSSEANPAEVVDPDHFVRDYIHVYEIAEIIKRTLNAELEQYTVMNVASGNSISTTELLKKMEAAGIKPFYKITNPVFPSFSAADTTLLKKITGFEPSPAFDFNNS